MILKFKCDKCGKKFDGRPTTIINQDTGEYLHLCFDCRVLEKRKEIEKKYIQNKTHFQSLINASEKEKDDALKLLENEA